MKSRVVYMGAAAGLLLAVIGVAGCGVRGETTTAGIDLYGSCTTCHGAAGEGNAAVGAPKIASLPRWYVASQLERFQNGLRGKHADDVEGLRMRAMARQMMSKAEVDAVASYVASLAPVISPRTLAVDPAGPEAYAVCGACHGPKGEGNEVLNAPPIAGLEDWYVARQLRKYQAGVRGMAKDDTIGPQMAGMAATVLPDQVDRVAAYVHALGAR